MKQMSAISEILNNPFQVINTRLSSIETLLIELRLSSSTQKETDQEEILNVKQASELLDLAVPTIYAMTSNRILPHSKRGKKLYFQKSELLEWIRAGRKKTRSEIVNQ